ncbi:MAG: phage tail-type lysozyme domain-containing protein [Candidatus Nomurabacteria bacterium]|jgi:hypothetical protein|nr:phage tail-type lysozyme domain-containing protein [Candidatus Nomurabacteria bacterium]
MRSIKKSYGRKFLPPFWVQAGLFLLAGLAFYGLSNLAIAGSGSGEFSGQQRLVKIIDGGTERTVATRAGTVEELFHEQGISVDGGDSLSISLYEPLTEKYYELEIRRTRPVLIHDMGATIKILTAETTVEGIVDAAGVTLYEVDTAELAPVRDVLNSGGAGLELVITRNDTIVEISENEAIPYETEQQKDATQDKDFKEVVTAGAIGNRVNYYKVTIKAGRETSRQLVRSEVTKEPVKQIEKIGIKYSGIYTTPSENEAITWAYLRNQGFAPHQAAGIMGNLMQEHGFQTSGDGLAQWTGGRKNNLMRMADGRGVAYTDIYVQLDFMMSELNGGYASTKNRIMASTTVEDATIAFQNGYERCGICVENRRIGFAIGILERYQ